MSCVSEGANPKRIRHKTAKGAKYSRQLLYSETSRIVRRLKNQKELFDDLLQTNNVTMMDREVAKLDELQNQLVETYTQIRESHQNEVNVVMSKEDEERLQNLVDVVDKEDAAVFEIKKNVSTWMVSQNEEVEVSSVKSDRSSRSAKSVQNLQRSGRSNSVKSRSSRRSGSHDSARSVASDHSVRSVKSDGSRSSRVSRKAEVAGLKAKVEILKKDGKDEIAEEIRQRRLELDQYEKEQTAILQSEIAGIEDQIIQNEDDDIDNKTDVSLNEGKKETMKDKHVVHVLEQMNALQESQRRKEASVCKQTPIRQERTEVSESRNTCSRGMKLIEDKIVRIKPPSVMDAIREKRVTIDESRETVQISPRK